MNCLIGIDGGGSRTKVLAVDHSGSFLAYASGSPTNIQLVDGNTFRKTMASLLAEVFAQAKLNATAVDFLVGGFAGAGRTGDIEFLDSVFLEMEFKNRYSVVTDMEVALYGAFMDGPGIIINAGTGSAAFCRDHTGTVRRCGGWGYIIGDEGSGYHIGRSAVQYALKSHDGMLPATSLIRIICEELQLDSIEQIVSKIYSGAVTRLDVAELAPRVFDAAAGDSGAQSIIKEAGKSLGMLAETLLRTYHFKEKQVKMCLTGSILKKRNVLLPYVLENIRHDVRVVEPQFPPVVGAVLMAFKMADIPVNDSVNANLRKVKY